MASANTPTRGEPISLLDVRRVFGYGNNSVPGDDLSDYYGIPYYDTRSSTFFAKGKFPTSGEINLEDFYDKSSEDPVEPNFFIDKTPGSNKTYTIPAYRSFVKVEIWGGGGGAGTGDHDAVRATGQSGTASSLRLTSLTSTSVLTAGGGSGGTSGYRYGTQSGTGGGGGVASNTGSFKIGTTEPTIVKTNGNSGQNGDAGAGKGGYGGDAPPVTPGRQDARGYVGSIGANTVGGEGGNYGGYNTTPRSNGKPGIAPGGGGGSGGDSDFQSGKNANPNRSAGGAGGSGAYASLMFSRSVVPPGERVTYTIGAGGAGTKTGNQGTGGDGAAGGFKISWR